jgi:hypothetical protein
MASNFKISTAARDAACDAIVDLVDGGAGAGTIEIRTGAPPATPATADSGTLLGTLTLSDPAFGAASTGTATANSITSDSTADASGDAGHFRVKDSSGNVIMQGTAGEAADSADLTFDEKSIVAGGVIAITSFTVTVPVGGT